MNKLILKAALVLMMLGILLPAEISAEEVKVWTSDVVIDDWADNLVKELKPVYIVGARNGTFAGKVVVESVNAISAMKANISVLKGKNGSVIPESNIQLRYPKDWEIVNWGWPSRGDMLLEAPRDAAPTKGRALLPVWISIKVPKDAKAEIYTGQLKVAGFTVPVNLEVEDWTLPDPQDYRTFTDFVQSPDTLALEYKVPLWSKKHWELIDRSFQLLSTTGGRTLYVPLICRTNFGNEQSMVRWISKPNGKYEYDYSILDKYLDSAEKNLGKPKLVVFIVWDICMSANALKVGLQTYNEDKGKTITESRKQLLGKGPRVTVLNPSTEQTTMVFLPRYEDPSSRALWNPMFTEVKKRMKARGLEKSMMLGIMPDLWPSKEEVSFWKEVSGDLAWVIHGHSGSPSDVMIGNKGLYKIADIGYAAFVYNLTWTVNPAKGHTYGWKNPALLSAYDRLSGYNQDSLTLRHLPEFNITGAQRGPGRIAADMWPAIRNKNGLLSGQVFSRYPENNWRNLDMTSWVLAPGPEGAVSTSRLENLREGVQECEARIYLEDALLDSGKKAKLGSNLAKRSQEVLDERQHALWKTVWNNESDLASVNIGVGSEGQAVWGLWNALNAISGKKQLTWEKSKARFAEEMKKGREWWYASDWKDRDRKLFALAGEVESVLGGKSPVAAGGNSSGDIDYPEIIGNNTGLAKEKIIELLKNPGIKNDDVIVLCAAAEITKADTAELYKKRKKVNTRYEFVNDLNLKNEEKAEFDALVLKLKSAVKK